MNCYNNYLFHCEKLLQLTSKDVYLSYLPLAHIFDRVIEELFIYEAASIGFWRGVSYRTVSFDYRICFIMDLVILYMICFLQDVKILIEDISALKPTIFCAVPRVLERIYNGKYFARLVF